MKIYLFEGQNGASIIYNPVGLSSDDLDRAVIVDTLPEPEEREGFYSQIFCRKETEEVWYEYLPILEDNAESLEK